MLLSDYEKAQKLRNEITHLKSTKETLDKGKKFKLEVYNKAFDLDAIIDISEYVIVDDLKSEISRRIEEKEKEFNNL